MPAVKKSNIYLCPYCTVWVNSNYQLRTHMKFEHKDKVVV